MIKNKENQVNSYSTINITKQAMKMSKLEAGFEKHRDVWFKIGPWNLKKKNINIFAPKCSKSKNNK